MPKQCYKCGKPIVFRNWKGNNIVCDAKAVYVIPGGGEEEYISARGNLIKGHSADDGILCYRIHECK